MFNIWCHKETLQYIDPMPIREGNVEYYDDFNQWSLVWDYISQMYSSLNHRSLKHKTILTRTLSS